MTKRTVEEIQEFLENLFEDRCLSDFTTDVTELKDGGYYLTLTAMYDRPSLSFKDLLAIAEFFGTQNLDPRQGSTQYGCETCDYGSSYGFELKVRP